jgi:hypothetical protein
MRWLAEIDASKQAFTFCLSLPDEFEWITPDQLALVFAAMARRFSSVRAFRRVAAAWKREMQKRGALHWHLVLWGLESPELQASVRSWLVGTWLDLLSAYFPPDAIERMRKVHAHDRNWIELKGNNWASYVSKYLGKDTDSDVSAIPGRWWGSWNKHAIPRVLPSVMELPEPVANDFARQFCKHREKKATAALNRSVARDLPTSSPFGFPPVRVDDSGRLAMDGGSPLTPWDVQRLKSGYAPHGRDPVAAAAILRTVRDAERLAGRRFGRWVPRDSNGNRIPSTVAIVAVGASLPADALRVIENSCRNRGFPVPKLISFDEIQATAAAASDSFLAAHRAASLPSRLPVPDGSGSGGIPPQQTAFAFDSESVGPCAIDLLASRRASAAALRRRRLGGAFAGVAD